MSDYTRTVSTTGYCDKCKSVQVIVSTAAARPVAQALVPAAQVKALLDCGHRENLVMSVLNIDNVAGQ